MRRLAKYMSAVCEKLKVKQLRVLLIVFGVTGTLVFGHTIFYPFAFTPQITPIRGPRNDFVNGINERTVYNRELYRRIKVYKAMLNDSVIKVRPGLRDTLAFLELIYKNR